MSLLPHASATEIETLTIITEQCINTSLKAHAAVEEAAEHATSEPVTQLFLEIDAMDYCKKWYKAVVVEGDLHGDDSVKVHFVGCTFPLNYLASTSSIHQHELPVFTQCTGESKFDEAIQRSEVPDRIRPRTESCSVGPNASESYSEIKQNYQVPEAAVKSTNSTKNINPQLSPIQALVLVIPSAILHMPISSSLLVLLTPPSRPLTVPVRNIGSAHVVQ